VIITTPTNEPTKAHSFTNVTILQQTRSYMFRASLANYHGQHNCTWQLPNRQNKFTTLMQLFCKTVYCLMTGQWGPKHVAAGVM